MSTPEQASSTERGIVGRVETLLAWGRATVVGDLVQRFLDAELLDRAFVLAAQAFVALAPLILVVTGVFSSGDQNVVAGQLIERFGLADAAAGVVRTLFTTPTNGGGVYVLGVVITVYSAFSLSKRVARAYAAIWRVRPPGPRSMVWRGLTWLLIEMALMFSVTGLRSLARSEGLFLALAIAAVVLFLWAGADVLTQNLLLRGQIALSRLWISGAVTSVGRCGIAVWAAIYLPASLTRQALQYGPIGVVFALFTMLFSIAAVFLIGPLVACVVTERPYSRWFDSTWRTPIATEHVPDQE